MSFQTIEIPGQEAMNFLSQYRSQFSRTGMYPFLIGDAEEYQRMMDGGSFDKRSLEEIVSASTQLHVDELIQERINQAAEDGIGEADFLGEWTGERSPKGRVSLHQDILTHEIKPVIFCGLARIKFPWQLPAATRYGAWNECPAPEEHCAFFRRWEQQFGAQIAGMSGDVIECFVESPPTSKDDAIALAREQYWFCKDIVEQGIRSISALAGTLMNSHYWYFWWD